MKRILTVLFICLAVASCKSTHVAKTTSGSELIYPFSEKQAFEVAQEELRNFFPDRNLRILSHADRGYFTKSREGWSRYNQRLHVIPVSGQTADGKTIEGYQFKVTGSGASQEGKVLNKKFFDTVQREVKKYDIGVLVTNVQPRPYSLKKTPAILAEFARRRRPE